MEHEEELLNLIQSVINEVADVKVWIPDHSTELASIQTELERTNRILGEILRAVRR
jgi:hypothetical protein